MHRTTTLLIAAAAFAAATGSIAAPVSIEGAPTIVDGDTVTVQGIPVRLKGVDAPELGDRFGREATRAMQAIAGSWLGCELTGEKTYNREVGYCRNFKGEDIAEAIIKQGFALACPRYSDRYLKFEQPDAVTRLPRASYCLRAPVAPRPQPPETLASGVASRATSAAMGKSITCPGSVITTRPSLIHLTANAGFAARSRPKMRVGAKSSDE
jgi:hypothetical protein